jgi:hypothetical protein
LKLVKDLAQVGQEPHGAATADGQADDFRGGGSFPEPGRGHQDGGAGA